MANLLPTKAIKKSIVTQRQRILIVDQKNMLRLWLEEKVARRELTPAQGDTMLREQETQFKLWAGSVKDGFETSRLFFKLARDFASWKGAQVVFSKSRAGHDLVTFKGWPAGRKIITGTRYRLDNPKIVELQIGKTGLANAAKKSARFGIWLVVAVDIFAAVVNDKATIGSLLGSLTVDIPSVMLASAIGAAAGTMVTGASVGTLAVIGSFALGPLAVAFVVGVIAGLLLFELDKDLRLSEKLGDAYDRGLAKLAEVKTALGHDAEERFRQLAHSQMVHDLQQSTEALAEKIARQVDRVRGELAFLR